MIDIELHTIKKNDNYIKINKKVNYSKLYNILEQKKTILKNQWPRYLLT